MYTIQLASPETFLENISEPPGTIRLEVVGPAIDESPTLDAFKSAHGREPTEDEIRKMKFKDGPVLDEFDATLISLNVKSDGFIMVITVFERTLMVNAGRWELRMVSLNADPPQDMLREE